LACEILRLSIFLDGTNIQKDLFEAAGELLNKDWTLSTASDPKVERASRRLLAFSLIRSQLKEAFAVYILVQQVML